MMTKSTVVDNETGKSVDSTVRTSTGTFFARGQDHTIAEVEKRIAMVSRCTRGTGAGRAKGPLLPPVQLGCVLECAASTPDFPFGQVHPCCCLVRLLRTGQEAAAGISGLDSLHPHSEVSKMAG